MRGSLKFLKKRLDIVRRQKELILLEEARLVRLIKQEEEKYKAKRIG
ncbi:hypothetical protein TBCH5v1_0010 [Thermococcus barophilus]|uniref:Uncharacterized protein n=1 Tax=Thermococcus barophilus TaxID=55802 RepID=A0A0S1X8A9_THEBA|nr:hypothetical protein TBCH5v1_0010 [Thermococcus barophilus]